MTVHGYVTHAAQNRRLTGYLFAAYMVAFQFIAIFVLTWFLLMFDEENTVLSNPAGYALRYALPVAVVTALLFWNHYRGHAKDVARMLNIKIVDRAQEPRFFAIAEEQCTALGVRLPRFGVIETPALNALTVGEDADRCLIAATRGLLNALDDDELAAVLAHEASHVRQGDTKVLAANHALMRTAVILQTHNILRLEDWRQLIIPLLLPATLPLFLVSGMVTQGSMRLARFARRGLKLTRDHIADGEAVRVTHHPEALLSALRKVAGRGRFDGGERFEAMLFDGQTDQEGGTHPSAQERMESIRSLGAGLMQPGRSRRDTRLGRAPQGGAFGKRGAMTAAQSQNAGPASGFGRRATPSAQATTSAQPLPWSARPSAQTPPELLQRPQLSMLLLFFTDRERFWRWQNESIDALEWREQDDRNIFGIAPKMVFPTALASVIIIGLHFPVDGDFSTFTRDLGPGALVEMAREVNGGPFCSGPSYPDGKCD